MREKTEWHRIVVPEPLVREVERGVRRGSRLFVEGSLEYRTWRDRSGVERWATEIVARDLLVLDPPSRTTGDASARRRTER